MLLLLSRFSRVRLCATPEMAAHQGPQSLGFFRKEHWSGLPFPSPMHESETWKWSHSVMSDSSRPHGLQPTRLLVRWILQARVLEWGCQTIKVQIHGMYTPEWTLTVDFGYTVSIHCRYTGLLTWCVLMCQCRFNCNKFTALMLIMGRPCICWSRYIC